MFSTISAKTKFGEDETDVVPSLEALPQHEVCTFYIRQTLQKEHKYTSKGDYVELGVCVSFFLGELLLKEEI